MPLPTNHSSPIETAVSSILEKTGIVEPKHHFSQALECNGIDVDSLAAQLASLIYSAREGVRLKAIELALAGHGIELKTSEGAHNIPNIIFNINTSDAQRTQMMFSPNREIKTLQEMSLLNEPSSNSD